MSPLFSRILLTNDDGFDSTGISVLAQIAATVAKDVWIVAPHQDQSGMAQSISINAPLRGRRRGDQRWAIDGTPADCVVLALSHFMKNTPPSLILSGINPGANTGDDVNISGTLGAAFAGLMMGIPSIAVSLDYASRKTIKWDTARTIVPGLLSALAQKGWDNSHCLSINIPDLPAEEISKMSWTHPAQKTIPGFHVEKREDLREKDYFWLYPRKDDAFVDSDSDISALQRGEISVSALTLDRSTAIKRER